MTQITNKLLKEAIADAEAVRETAIANAKLVLEESMGPQIKEMIRRRITAEASETPHEDGEAEGSTEFPADSSDIGKKPNEEPSDDAFDTSDIGDNDEAPEDSEDDWYEDWDESDLAEIIKELENDIAALKGKSDDDEDEMEDDDVVGLAAAEDAEEKAAEEMDDEEKLTESMHDEEDKKEDDEEKDDDEVDLEEILRELDMGDEEDEIEDVDAEKEDAEKEALKAEVVKLRNELRQYHSALSTVRERLHEVNLLNAKLLFTNKLFRKEGLNNDQKVRIVESFDRATTVREVKLVYTALMENISTAGKTSNGSRKKVVAEGLASKATRSTAPRSKDVIVENAVAKRLQELAGII
jgi:hypothetical protein